MTLMKSGIIPDGIFPFSSLQLSRYLRTLDNTITFVFSAEADVSFVGGKTPQPNSRDPENYYLKKRGEGKEG